MSKNKMTIAVKQIRLFHAEAQLSRCKAERKFNIGISLSDKIEWNGKQPTKSLNKIFKKQQA